MISFNKRSIIGIFDNVDIAADAVDSLKDSGYAENEYDILTDTPYPEGTFGEGEPVHKLFRWPLFGAACGFSVAMILTVGTSLAYPLVVGGKPILSLPAMSIIMYEGSMLGAIIMTVVGIIFESRLPRLFMGAYDERVTDGYIGITVTCEEDRIALAEEKLRDSGAEDIKYGWKD